MFGRWRAAVRHVPSTKLEGNRTMYTHREDVIAHCIEAQNLAASAYARGDKNGAAHHYERVAYCQEMLAEFNPLMNGGKLAAINFELAMMGGGCLAYRRELDNGGHILVTDIDGSGTRLEDGEPVLVGIYTGADYDEGQCVEFASFDEAYAVLDTDANSVEAMATVFAKVLQSWLTPEQFETVRQRNRSQEPCASHDFCDANMAMDAAFRMVMGRDFEHDGETERGQVDCDTFNAAWGLAVVRYLRASDDEPASILSDAGFVVEDMSGGTSAWVRPNEDGTCFMLGTASDGMTHRLEAGERIQVARLDNGYEQIGKTHEFATLAEALEFIREESTKSLSVNDGTLDAFVLDYCERNSIECDGDVFGLVFSGAEEFSIGDAVTIIHNAAYLWELRR